MINIRKLDKKEIKYTDEISKIHIKTFKGFFLTFMGYGFLKQMYVSYCEDEKSGIIIAEENENIFGFLAYSEDVSSLYKSMIKKRLLLFAFYAFGAFLRKPAIFIRLVRAFLKPSETKRKEKYIELASIGVDPDKKSKGIGSMLIDYLKDITDFEKFEYISLETDAENNEAANHFYLKNKFVLCRVYETPEGRKMNEYRFGKNDM